MIDKIFRKLSFLYLKGSVDSFEQFKKKIFLNQLNSKNFNENKERLRPYYKEYITKVSRADMAASLELATFLFTLCKINKYTKLLDLGSGLSSFVFRLYAKETPGVVVFSVDDDVAWLGKTKDYLLQQGLNTDHLLSLEEFIGSKESGFDCILNDLNFVEVRIQYVDLLLQIVKQNGVVIMDDVHKADYYHSLLKKLSKKDVENFSLKDITTDDFGRFSMAVRKK